MLVVDVPEDARLEHPLHVGKLEEDVDLALADGLAHQAHELLHRADVLQRVTAGDVVRLQVRILRAVEVEDEAHALGGAALVALRMVARVDADAVATAQLAQPGEELALAAADLERRLTPDADRISRSGRGRSRRRNLRKRGENACVSSYAALYWFRPMSKRALPMKPQS